MSSYVLRQRDRRESMSDLLAALTRALDRRFDVSLMRGAFETALGRIVPVRSVHLRESGNRWGGRAATHSPESVTLEVPGADAESQGLLEVAFDSDCRLGDWDFQMLGTAANLGALVLEIERSRTQLARAGLLNPSRVRRDGAAPLIGSTTVMCGLRAAIERVAATDFTILLEGESGVGKELVARQIHELSRRRNGPFVAINCAALVETLLEAELFGIEERTATGVRGRRGKFEAAENGTLFLDEVSDLSLSAQAKLLARDPGSGGRAGRRAIGPAVGYPDRGGHQSQSGVAGGAAAVSSGSLLSPERRRHSGTEPPRAPAGHPGTRALFSRAPSSHSACCVYRQARPTR